MGAFAEVVTLMGKMDVFRLFFPWLLILSITYGLLEKYELLGDDSTVNGVAALAVAFLTIGGALFMLGPDTRLFTHFGVAIGFSMFALLGYLLLLAVAGYDIGEGMDESSLPVIGAIVLAVVSFIGVLAFQLPLNDLLGGVENTFDEVVMPILILVFLMIIVSLTLSDGGE